MLAVHIDWPSIVVQAVTVLVPVLLFVLATSKSARNAIMKTIGRLRDDVHEIRKDCSVIQNDVSHLAEQTRVAGEQITELHRATQVHGSACDPERKLNRADIDRNASDIKGHGKQLRELEQRARDPH